MEMIPSIAAWLGVHPTSILFTVMVFTGACKLGARLIPADSTGKMKVARQTLSFFGANVQTRVTKGVPLDRAIREGYHPPVRHAPREVHKMVQDFEPRHDSGVPPGDPIDDYFASVSVHEDESK